MISLNLMKDKISKNYKKSLNKMIKQEVKQMVLQKNSIQPQKLYYLKSNINRFFQMIFRYLRQTLQEFQAFD